MDGRFGEMLRLSRREATLLLFLRLFHAGIASTAISPPSICSLARSDGRVRAPSPAEDTAHRGKAVYM